MKTITSTFWAILFSMSLAYAQEQEASCEAEPLQKNVQNAEEEANADTEDGEMTISSDRMEMHYGESIELDGNVIVSDKMKMLTADKMVVELDESNQAKKIEATGQVTVRRLDASDSATGDRGIYDLEKKEIVLDGNCTIIHEDKGERHIMKSPQVIYDVERRRFYTQKGAGENAPRPTITIPTRNAEQKDPLNSVKPSKQNKKKAKTKSNPEISDEK